MKDEGRDDEDRAAAANGDKGMKMEIDSEETWVHQV